MSEPRPANDADPGPTSPALQPVARPAPSFAHGSEAELSRILDFYEVRWEYEPHVFPILWNSDGDVLESFSPDFYLPELDLYVELTTLKQKLVRKKNRKLRRLRELYPDLRIKLFYAKDFRALMLKYGRLALADGLTGASGQVVPDRPAHQSAVARSDSGLKDTGSAGERAESTDEPIPGVTEQPVGAPARTTTPPRSPAGADAALGPVVVSDSTRSRRAGARRRRRAAQSSIRVPVGTSVTAGSLDGASSGTVSTGRDVAGAGDVPAIER